MLVIWKTISNVIFLLSTITPLFFKWLSQSSDIVCPDMHHQIHRNCISNKYVFCFASFLSKILTPAFVSFPLQMLYNDGDFPFPIIEDLYEVNSHHMQVFNPTRPSFEYQLFFGSNVWTRCLAFVRQASFQLSHSTAVESHFSVWEMTLTSQWITFHTDFSVLSMR
jgi:hypothetical protein